MDNTGHFYPRIENVRLSLVNIAFSFFNHYLGSAIFLIGKLGGGGGGGWGKAIILFWPFGLGQSVMVNGQKF